MSGRHYCEGQPLAERQRGPLLVRVSFDAYEEEEDTELFWLFTRTTRIAQYLRSLMREMAKT